MLVSSRATLLAVPRSLRIGGFLFAATLATTLVQADNYAINCGGPISVTGPGGQVWEADRHFFYGTPVFSTNSVQNAHAQALLRMAREADSATPDFGYQFAVSAPGRFKVDLHFADLRYSRAGDRIFDVVLNQQTVLSNFDIVSQAGGGHRAIVRTFTTDVTGPSFQIIFRSVKNQAIVNAIQVTRLGDLPSTGSTPPPAPVNVTVAPQNPTLNSGATQQFTATVTGSSNTGVTWTSTGGSISAAGLFTAPSVSSAATFAVTARSNADASKSATTNVTVNPLPAAPTVTISISPTSGTVASGGTMQFTATVGGSANQGVTWSASGGAINGSGLFTAPTVSSNASVTVTARSNADSSKTASATVTVNAPAPVVNISVTPQNPTIVAGGTQQFNATVTGSSNTGVSWTATGGTISPSGLFSAPNVSVPTIFGITARSNADASKTASTNITVDPAPQATPPPPTPTGSIVFLETNGQIVLEAENGLVTNRNGHSWSPATNIAGFSGASFLAAMPNTGVNRSSDYINVAPEVQFQVRFAQAGTYHVWVRGYGESFADDSVHVGLNGARQTTGETISDFAVLPSSWSWAGYSMDRTRRATLAVPSAGIHTINVWMREDGFRLDRLLLTTNPAFTPTGQGPAESPRETSNPVLSVNPTALAFNSTAGTSPAAQSFGITNNGGGSLNWSIQSNQSWATVNPSSGTGAATVTVNINSAGMGAGTFTADLTVNSNGAGSPATVRITLTIGAAPTPRLSVNPTSLAFAAMAGQAAGSQNLAITNAGGGTLNWTVSKTQSWLAISPTTGSGSGAPQVSATASGLTAGSYSDTIRVEAPGAANSPVLIPVNFTVSAPQSSTSTQAPIPNVTGNQFYVATNGSANGDGSQARPWDLQTALNHPASVKPGDTIWVRGGVYGNRGQFNARLRGTETKPIIVRAFPGERATLNASLQAGCCGAYSDPNAGAYMWFWGLEIRDDQQNRAFHAMDIYAKGSRIINMVVHDCLVGMGWWRGAEEGEVHGTLSYYNGYIGSNRGHGHGLYSQNRNGRKLVTDNIFFGNFGFGLHLYASGSSAVRNYTVEGNVSWNSGMPSGGTGDNLFAAGGEGGLQGMIIRNNHSYSSPGHENYNRFGWDPGEDAVITDNYFIGGFFPIEFAGWRSLTFQNNTIYGSQYTGSAKAFGRDLRSWNVNNNRYFGFDRRFLESSTTNFAGWKSSTGWDSNSTLSTSRPTGTWTFVRPNKYEPGRANIIVYNWDRRSTVPVDVSGVLEVGKRYEVRDAQNFYGPPALEGVYAGGALQLPMNLTASAPVLGGARVQPPHTDPEFNVFVLLPKP